MTNTPREAIAWLRAQSKHRTQSWDNLCLQGVRMSLGIPSRDYCAEEAWNNAQKKHRVNSGAQCPKGAAVFWTNGGYGHIVLSVGGGMCYSNDILRQGQYDLTRIDYITDRWGQNFQGWTEDLNGVHYYQPNRSVEWKVGTVYVAKLHKGAHDSDSVRRLQYRLLHLEGVPAKDVRLTGNYGDGTAAAVSHWQRKVNDSDGPKDGKSISNRQAKALFGSNYHLIEAK